MRLRFYQKSLKGGEFQLIVRFLIIGFAAVISLFCLNFDPKKAESADGGLQPLGISESPIPAISTPQISLDEEPIEEASEVQPGIPETKSDTPAEKPAAPETAGDTLRDSVTEALINVSGIASETAATVDDTTDKVFSNETDGIASKTTETVGNTADKVVTGVTDIVSKATDTVDDTVGKVVTDVTDIVSKTTGTVDDMADKTGVNIRSVPSKPAVFEPASGNLPTTGNAPAVLPIRQTKLSMPSTGEGISKQPKAERHAETKQQERPLPKPLPKNHSSLIVLSPVSILSGERRSSGKSPRDNAGSDSYGKQSMVEGHLIDLSLPRYTGHLFHSRDRGINQWSQPPPEKPPQSTFFS